MFRKDLVTAGNPGVIPALWLKTDFKTAQIDTIHKLDLKTYEVSTLLSNLASRHSINFTRIPNLVHLSRNIALNHLKFQVHCRKQLKDLSIASSPKRRQLTLSLNWIDSLKLIDPLLLSIRSPRKSIPSL